MVNMEIFQKQNEKLLELGFKLQELQKFDFKVSFDYSSINYSKRNLFLLLIHLSFYLFCILRSECFTNI